MRPEKPGFTVSKEPEAASCQVQLVLMGERANQKPLMELKIIVVFAERYET